MKKICRVCSRDDTQTIFYEYRARICRDCDVAAAKKWAASNREKVRQIAKDWREANVEWVKSYDNTSPLRKDRSHRHRWKVVFLLQKQVGKCACCRETLPERFDVDHILPKKLGGTSVITNLQILCEPCNREKSFKHPVQFMQEKGYLL